MNKPRHNMFSIAKNEIILLKSEDTKLFQNQPANWRTQIQGGICFWCSKFYPKYFYKDYEFEDISYQDEKQKWVKV